MTHTTAMTHTTETTDTTGTSYSALEHTITTDGGWPVCAGCGEPGSHEQCVAAEHAADEAARERAERRGSWPVVALDRDAVWAWLCAEDPDEPGHSRAARWLYPGSGAPVLDDAEQLVDEAGRAGLVGPDVRVGLWLDREPADAGPAIGWHLTVEIAPEITAGPGGEALRLAGTWAEVSLLFCPCHDAGGVDGLVDVLAVVAADATEVLARSLAAVTAWCRGRGPAGR